MTREGYIERLWHPSFANLRQQGESFVLRNKDERAATNWWETKVTGSDGSSILISTVTIATPLNSHAKSCTLSPEDVWFQPTILEWNFPNMHCGRKLPGDSIGSLRWRHWRLLSRCSGSKLGSFQSSELARCWGWFGNSRFDFTRPCSLSPHSSKPISKILHFVWETVLETYKERGQVVFWLFVSFVIFP